MVAAGFLAVRIMSSRPTGLLVAGFLPSPDMPPYSVHAPRKYTLLARRDILTERTNEPTKLVDADTSHTNYGYTYDDTVTRYTRSMGAAHLGYDAVSQAGRPGNGKQGRLAAWLRRVRAFA